MTWSFGLLRPTGYSVIYCDFPWSFETYSGAGVPQRAEEQHYDTMTVQDGARLPVHQLGHPDCALFMWCTSSHTEQMFWLARQWGFRFSSKAFSWAKLNKHAEHNHAKEFGRWGNDVPGAPAPRIKDQSNWFMGMGHGTRRNTEDCWLFTRGKPQRALFDKDGKMQQDRGVRELIVSPIREHSRKPDETYARIERLYTGPYCELFSRSSRSGWSSWGNQEGRFAPG